MCYPTSFFSNKIYQIGFNKSQKVHVNSIVLKEFCVLIAHGQCMDAERHSNELIEARG